MSSSSASVPGSISYKSIYTTFGFLPSISIDVDAVVINDGTGEYNNPYVIGQNNINNNDTDIYTGGIGDKNSQGGHTGGSG